MQLKPLQKKTKKKSKIVEAMGNLVSNKIADEKHWILENTSNEPSKFKTKKLG